MNELVLRAESFLRLLGHYLEPVRLVIFFYRIVRWLIKLPGRAVSAYREVRDLFLFLSDLPLRMVEGFMRAVVAVGLVALIWTALSGMAAKIRAPHRGRWIGCHRGDASLSRGQRKNCQRRFLAPSNSAREKWRCKYQ